jgi:hypothetical protein
MQDWLHTAQVISATAFIAYGIACFCSSKLSQEFVRYGFGPYCRLIGSLEIAGGIGLLAGFVYTPLRQLSALCLALLMFCALLVRIKIRDPIVASFPALFLMLLNFAIALL